MLCVDLSYLLFIVVGIIKIWYGWTEHDDHYEIKKFIILKGYKNQGWVCKKIE